MKKGKKIKVGLVNLSKLEKFRENPSFQNDICFLTENNIDFVDYCLDYDKPEDLLRGFHKALKNPEIDLIFFVRGGEKLTRFVNDIDWSLVKRANKKYIGFSDPTNFFFFATRYGQTCYYGTNLLNIHDRFNSDKFTEVDRKALVNFFKTGEEVPYNCKALFKEPVDLAQEKIIGGHLCISTFMLQYFSEFKISDNYLLLEYHLGRFSSFADLEFFIDQLKLIIRQDLPKGFVLGWSQLFNPNDSLMDADKVNQCFVDNLKEFDLPIMYVDHIVSPIKLEL